MLTTSRGLEIASEIPEVAACVDLFTEELVGLRKDTGALDRALALDPECVVVNAHAAARRLLADRLEGVTGARAYLHATHRRAPDASPHERAYLAAIESWAAGDISETTQRLEALLDAFPRDLMTLNLAMVRYFKRGRSEDMLRVCQKVLPANEDSPYIHGLHAFALEQCGDYDAAETAGRRGVALKCDEFGAQHAVTHVLEMQNRIGEGRAWLEKLSDSWNAANAITASHLWWHLAIFHLDLGDPQRALGLFDDHVWEDRVWGPEKETSRFPINGIHLLWRLQLADIDVGDRWRTVAARVRNRTNDPVEPYPSLLYLYALMRGGRQDAAEEMLRSIEGRALNAPPQDRAAWLDTALPTAHGLWAYARGDRGRARAHLAPQSSRAWIDLGHSPVQRSIFAAVLNDCQDAPAAGGHKA